MPKNIQVYKVIHKGPDSQRLADSDRQEVNQLILRNISKLQSSQQSLQGLYGSAELVEATVQSQLKSSRRRRASRMAESGSYNTMLKQRSLGRTHENSKPSPNVQLFEMFLKYRDQNEFHTTANVPKNTEVWT